MRGVVVVGMLVVFPGCGEDRGGRSAVVTTVDTAGGAVVVRNEGAAPRLELEELVALGSRGGLQQSAADEFGRVRRVLSNAEGDLYVADDLARQIKVFDSAGAFVRAIGRRGGGPGEIETLRDIAWVADSLLVMDPQNARLTYLTPEGEYIAQWPWARMSGSVIHFYLAGPAAYSWNMALGDRGEAPRAVWVRYTPQGPADTLPVVWRQETASAASEMLICRGSGGIGFFDHPYGRGLLGMPAPDEHVAGAWNDAYRIAFTDAAGDTVRIVEREAAPIPLTDERWAVVEEDLAEFRETWSGADCQGGVDRPEHLPILRGLGFTHDGRLTVEVNTADGPALDVYDRELAWVGQIPLPERDESVPLFLRDHRLHLVTRDSLDVQQVRVFRVGGGADGV